MTGPIEVVSYFDNQRRVTIDLWGPNPLLEDYRQINPELVSAEEAIVPAPTLFESGDLPPFTASGVDPEVLNRLPYTARHRAAAEPSRLAVLGLIEEYANDDTIELEHQGLGEYRVRITNWLRGHNRPKTGPTEEERNAAYAELFGDDG